MTLSIRSFIRGTKSSQCTRGATKRHIRLTRDEQGSKVLSGIRQNNATIDIGPINQFSYSVIDSCLDVKPFHGYPACRPRDRSIFWNMHNETSGTVCTLTVPVQSLAKGGGQH